jgi:NAD(P)-dependent dehydrogenase (short-subunit alcohol dehydrogenase family)
MKSTSKKPTVLITGVGKPGQLGATLVQTFAADGYLVHAVGRTLPDVEKLVEETRRRGDDAVAAKALYLSGPDSAVTTGQVIPM